MKRKKKQHIIICSLQHILCCLVILCVWAACSEVFTYMPVTNSYGTDYFRTVKYAIH